MLDLIRPRSSTSYSTGLRTAIDYSEVARNDFVLEPRFVMGRFRALENYEAAAQSDQVDTLIDMSTEWLRWGDLDVMPEAYLLNIEANDSGSAAATAASPTQVALTDTASRDLELGLRLSCTGLPNDAPSFAQGWVNANANGDFFLTADTSGSDTLDLTITVQGFRQ